MSQLKFADGRSLELPDMEEKGARYLADTWLNSGKTPDGEKIPWTSLAETLRPANRDLVTTTEVKALLAKSTEMIVREPIEPILSVTGLFNRISGFKN